MRSETLQVTNGMLGAWNSLRREAGEEPIDRAMAEAVLLKVDRKTREEMLARLSLTPQ